MRTKSDAIKVGPNKILISISFPCRISKNAYKDHAKREMKEKTPVRILSSVELLLVRLHIDTALQLSAGSPDLKAHSAVGNRLVEILQAFDTGVLH